MKRFLWLALALMLCAAGNPVLGEGIREDPMIITIAGEYVDSLSSGHEDPLLDHLEEKFNVSFVPLQIDNTDASYSYRLRAVANEFPDMMLYDSQWDFLYFIKSGALRALPSVISNHPNLRNLVTYPYASHFQYGESIWGLPRSIYAEESDLPGYCVLVRKEYLSKTGSQPPVTMEDWHDFLSAIRETDESVIPLTSRTPEAMYYLSYYYAPFANSWILENVEEGFLPGFYHESYCQRIDALRGLWDDGLLDTEFMEINSGRATGVDRFLLGQAACIVYPSSPHVVMSELMHKWSNLYPNDPIEDHVEALFLPCDQDGKYAKSQDLKMSAVYFSSNVDDMKMNRILSILDYLCSDEGLMLRHWGFEGVDYVLQDGAPVSLLPEGTTLYSKYPSYALFRILPNLDEQYMASDESLPKFVRYMNARCSDWESLCSVDRRYLTSLKATSVLTNTGVFFNPELTKNSFRMLTAPEGTAACFEKIRATYRSQGIEQLIFKVGVNI